MVVVSSPIDSGHLYIEDIKKPKSEDFVVNIRGLTQVMGEFIPFSLITFHKSQL